MSLNINKINSLLCLFEKASSLTVNNSPLVSDWYTSDCFDEYKTNDSVIEISWSDEDGLIFACNISAQNLSDSIIKNGIITVKDENGDDCDICLFKSSKLIDSNEETKLSKV